MFSAFLFMLLYYCCILPPGLLFSNHFCCSLILSFQSIGFMSYYYMFLEKEWQPTQYSCLENSMDKGTRQATVHGVAKRWAQLSN